MRNIRRFIGRYRVTYRSIFQISAIFCCKRYGKGFSHIVSAADKKGDIGRYIVRLGRYLKQGSYHHATIHRAAATTWAETNPNQKQVNLRFKGSNPFQIQAQTQDPQIKKENGFKFSNQQRIRVVSHQDPTCFKFRFDLHEQ